MVMRFLLVRTHRRRGGRRRSVGGRIRTWGFPAPRDAAVTGVAAHEISYQGDFKGPLGHFTWKEWADALAAELAAAVDRDEADDGTEYYYHWVAALEKLVAAKGLAGEPELYERKEAWADAYRHTPHGHPVQLRPGL